ncbi:MAG TPA: DUF882 domain-containing protein [Polyangia bacterium]|jgi:uncharacterized protein YcbK (DUF882 family)
MIPLLSIALTLISNVTDLAHMFVPDHLDERPAFTFYFENRHEEASFALFDEYGDAQPDVMKDFSHFVRCWRTGREKPMSARTVEIVSLVAQHFNVGRIDVVSGYRAKPYGAPHSKHFLGRAMDIHVPGVKSKVVANWVWLNFRHVGVGYYPKQEFVHIDSRDIDVRWVDTSAHGESAHARYTGRLPSDDVLPEDAPMLAYDRTEQQSRKPIDRDVEQLAAVQNILASTFDPLQF